MKGLSFIACSHFGGGPDLVAVKAATGMLLWDYNVGDGSVASPVIANGVLYVAFHFPFQEENMDGLYALDDTTGDLLWQVRKRFF